MGDHLSGVCIKNYGKPVIAIISSMSIGRQRFSMAHELYHLFFDNNIHSIVCAKKIGTVKPLCSIGAVFLEALYKITKSYKTCYI